MDLSSLTDILSYVTVITDYISNLMGDIDYSNIISTISSLMGNIDLSNITSIISNLISTISGLM